MLLLCLSMASRDHRGGWGGRTLAVEIAAHSRTINAIDLHPSSMLVSWSHAREVELTRETDDLSASVQPECAVVQQYLL